MWGAVSILRLERPRQAALNMAFSVLATIFVLAASLLHVQAQHGGMGGGGMGGGGGSSKCMCYRNNRVFVLSTILLCLLSLEYRRLFKEGQTVRYKSIFSRGLYVLVRPISRSISREHTV